MTRLRQTIEQQQQQQQKQQLSIDGQVVKMQNLHCSLKSSLYIHKKVGKIYICKKTVHFTHSYVQSTFEICTTNYVMFSLETIFLDEL